MILLPTLIAILTLALCNLISWLRFRTLNRPMKMQFTLGELVFAPVCLGLTATLVMCTSLDGDYLSAAMMLVLPSAIFGLASGKFWNLTSAKPMDSSPVYCLALGAGVGVAIALASFYYLLLHAFVR